MNFTETALAGLWIVENAPFKDERGAFSRLFCSREMKEIFADRRIVQINHSLTKKVGALRGMHYQNPPHAEMKIVRCLQGRVFDAAVDLRAGSPTFLQWTACELTPENNRAFVIPEGCAHGFQVLEPDSQLLYLHTEFYTPASEGAVRFDDPMVGLQWQLTPTDISERDQNHPYLANDFEGIEI